MIIDTSAIVAILSNESGAKVLMVSVKLGECCWAALSRTLSWNPELFRNPRLLAWQTYK
jgi:uncharacterized protein with PIN domain